MTHTGQIKNGVVVFDDNGALLAEGSRVRIEPIEGGPIAVGAVLGLVPSFGLSWPGPREAMGSKEIIAALGRLSHRERREIIRHILSIEDEPELLADCDRRADEAFLMLDTMEAEDDQAAAR